MFFKLMVFPLRGFWNPAGSRSLSKSDMLEKWLRGTILGYLGCLDKAAVLKFSSVSFP